MVKLIGETLIGISLILGALTILGLLGSVLMNFRKSAFVGKLSLTLFVACITINCGVNYDPLAPDLKIHLIFI
jgi:hypothetical protein